MVILPQTSGSVVRFRIAHITTIFCSGRRFCETAFWDAVAKCETKSVRCTSALTTKTIFRTEKTGFEPKWPGFVSWRNLSSVNFKCSSIKFTCRWFRYVECVKKKWAFFLIQTSKCPTPFASDWESFFFYPNYLFSPNILIPTENAVVYV